ncbi:hypothetical protein BJX70DRAFT_401942 [Aspergillus crustosus]
MARLFGVAGTSRIPWKLGNMRLRRSLCLMQVPVSDSEDSSLIERVIIPGTLAEDEKNEQGISISDYEAPICRLPLEIALLIVDTIYMSRVFCRERINDSRSFLKATGWVLPKSSWVSRCMPKLVFEVQDLVDSGQDVD